MIRILTLLSVVLIMSGCSQSESHGDKNSSKKVETAELNTSVKETKKTASVQKSEIKKAILSIYTIDGKEILVNETKGGLTFQGSEGKAVFIVLFGYRCPPCLQEMPNLIALMAKKYPDLEIIAIEVQGLGSDELEIFKEEKGINYTLAVGSENNKFINYIASRAQWQGSIPFFLAFDKKGEVKVVHVGALSGEQLEAVYGDIHK